MTASLLFIDDNTGDTEIACWRLGKAGLHVEHRTVCNEQSLIVALAERQPGLILCDIVLPQWDCWAARRVCRQLVPVVPFVLYSGAVGIEDQRLARERGCFGWAEKDSPQQLIDIVTLALKVS